MALISLRQLLDHAAENGYGIPAFNVNNLEQVQAIMEAAREAWMMTGASRLEAASMMASACRSVSNLATTSGPGEVSGSSSTEKVWYIQSGVCTCMKYTSQGLFRIR